MWHLMLKKMKLRNNPQKKHGKTPTCIKQRITIFVSNTSVNIINL